MHSYTKLHSYTERGHTERGRCRSVKWRTTGNGFRHNHGIGLWPVNNMAMIEFNATAHGVQKHTKVAETETVYSIKRSDNWQTTALDCTGTLTLSAIS